MSVRTSSRQDPTQALQHFILADIEDDRRGRDPVVPKWKARAEVPGLSYRHMSRTLWTKPPCQTSGLRGSMASPLASIVISYPARRPRATTRSPKQAGRCCDRARWSRSSGRPSPSSWSLPAGVVAIIKVLSSVQIAYAGCRPRSMMLKTQAPRSSSGDDLDQSGTQYTRSGRGKGRLAATSSSCLALLVV